ncbi:MAG: AraC family transcriptional regulator, partial [Pseudomonadales bacterium]|nr:AraC family transcriptional regulator [Pseudomonadales bacterium]
MIETVSGIYLHYIEGYLKELDLDSEAIFRDSGLIYPEHIQSGNSVKLQVIANLIERVNLHSKKPGFAFQLGRRIPLMAHGNLGAAMLSSKDLRALLVLSERFSRLAFPSISLSVYEQGNNTVFKITANTGFSTLDVAIVDAILGTCIENLQRLSDTSIQPISITLSHKKPQHSEFYNTLLDNSIEFDSFDNTLIFSKKTMATPLKTADNIGQNILIEKCKNDLEDIEQNSPFISRTIEIIITNLSTPPSQAFV